MKPRIAAMLSLVMLAGCAVTYPGAMEAISGNDAINQLSADSAPQQAVVNGWTARDYLALVAQQNTEHSVLMYALIGLLVVIALALLTQNRRLAHVETVLSGSTPAQSGSPAPPPLD
jgi:hypothetical protein